LKTTKTPTARKFLRQIKKRYKTILADPPWRSKNRNSRIAPEYKERFRYPTLSLQEIMDIPVQSVALPNSHLYLWVINSMMQEGFQVMKAWGFTYKTSITWEKITKSGEPDKSTYGHYFRNATETILFGVRGHLNTSKKSHSFPNIIRARKREHSRKPDEQYKLIESCSPGPYLELFARHRRKKWDTFGNEVGKF
jgi:N6-adenosine-specific RNA methylase IME4